MCPLKTLSGAFSGGFVNEIATLRATPNALHIHCVLFAHSLDKASAANGHRRAIVARDMQLVKEGGNTLHIQITT